MKIIYYNTARLSRENLIGLKNLLSQCDETSHKEVLDVLNPQDYKSVICLYDDYEEICGFACLSEDCDNMISIDSLYIEPNSRRRGYAKKLLAAVERLCKNKNLKSIELNVEEKNKIARNLYEKCGYTYGNFNPRNSLHQMTKNLMLEKVNSDERVKE